MTTTNPTNQPVDTQIEYATVYYETPGKEIPYQVPKQLLSDHKALLAHLNTIQSGVGFNTSNTEISTKDGKTTLKKKAGRNG